MHVGATRGGGDRLQPGLVETRFHRGTRLVLDETASQIRRQGNELALGRPDADGVDLQALVLCRHFGGG